MQTYKDEKKGHFQRSNIYVFILLKFSFIFSVFFDLLFYFFLTIINNIEYFKIKLNLYS